ARTQVEPAPAGQRRFLRLDVERLYLGRTRLPAVAHRLLLSPMALKLLLWPLPAGIDDIKVERQQVVIRGGGEPRRSEAAIHRRPRRAPWSLRGCACLPSFPGGAPARRSARPPVEDRAWPVRRRNLAYLRGRRQRHFPA